MSDYIIYTKDNGVLNFTKDLKLFIGRNNVNINCWNNIYTNLKDFYNNNIVVKTTNLAANEKKNSRDINR